MKINNVEKRLEGKSDGSTARLLNKLAEAKNIKVAEKDPMTHTDLEFMNNITQGYKEAVENGFKGDIDEYINSLDLSELREIVLAEGGSVDFTNMSPGQMKSIFISENGYEPRSAKELVRGVKMYLKNLDIQGLPFGTFGKND
ncbi:hypothetical protein [Candidatus Pelagibacter bacterium nBUS_29]|uniref:hypothetical protein n=1 Tax=Candidatus Pelagibacter bacterium nBUS_29 TaxID=3374190 RepID=UPI003EBC7D85